MENDWIVSKAFTVTLKYLKYHHLWPFGHDPSAMTLQQYIKVYFLQIMKIYVGTYGNKMWSHKII